MVHLHGPLVMLANTLGWPAKGTELYRTGRHMEAMGNRARKFVAKHAESKHCVEDITNFYTQTIAAVKL